VGIYGDLPQEMRSRQLLTDRFVCVVRGATPRRQALHARAVRRLPHMQVAPRGKPGGYIDDVLRERGLTRTRRARGPLLRHGALSSPPRPTTCSRSPSASRERFAEPARPAAARGALKLRPYALSLVWHPRVDGDAGHRFLRDVFARAAKEAAGERHEAPRTRLDATDPTSGQARKRPRASVAWRRRVAPRCNYDFIAVALSATATLPIVVREDARPRAEERP
jgi:hypothetical protein